MAKKVSKESVKNDDQKKISHKAKKIAKKSIKVDVEATKDVNSKKRRLSNIVPKSVTEVTTKKKEKQKAINKTLSVPSVAKKLKIKLENKKKLKAGKFVSKTLKQQKTAPPAATFEAPTFDEQQFKSIVNFDNIKNVVEVLTKLVEEEVSNKKTIFSDYRYFLNVGAFKIPNCPKRMVKLSLVHSLAGKDDDIVIVVPDLQRGAKIDYEPTIEHYENLFREIGVENLNIIPFNKLRKEYNTFEAVRKLANTYDYFMCDGRIVGQVAGFCGKVFQKPRTVFHAVRMENTDNLKREIEKSLRRTAFRQIKKGDLVSIPVGTNRHNSEELSQNIQLIVSQLSTNYPGGLSNIRSLYLKIDITGTSSLPIYVSTSQPPTEVPYIIGIREKRMLALKKQANEVLKKFNLTKEAKFIKLTKDQENRKRKLKELHAAIKTEDSVDVSESLTSQSENNTKKKIKTNM